MSKIKIKPMSIMLIDNKMQTRRNGWTFSELERYKKEFGDRCQIIKNDIIPMTLRYLRFKGSRSSTWYIFEDTNTNNQYHMSASHFSAMFRRGVINGLMIENQSFYFTKVGTAISLAMA